MKKGIFFTLLAGAVLAFAFFAFEPDRGVETQNYSFNDYSGAAWGETQEPSEDRTVRVAEEVAIQRSISSTPNLVVGLNDYSGAAWGN